MIKKVPQPVKYQALVDFSSGRLSRAQAIEALGFRDNAEFLAALGNVELPLPVEAAEIIEAQADTFVKLLEAMLKMSKLC